jgi:hypothetical protein
MRTIKFMIAKNSSKTEAQYIKPSQHARMPGFNSDIKDLAIVLEDKGAKAIYYTRSTRKGFTKNDPLEFNKIWLEYHPSDRDYSVEVQVD